MNETVVSVPRVLIAGTGSGCGKTTATLALLTALKNRGLDAGAAKCGPDYIDPMFHRSVVGAPSSNLDPFFFDANTMRFLLAENGAGRDVTVIEGVMGYYDGLGLTSSRASAFDAAEKTLSPVILTVNASGASLSILAQIQGFLSFVPQSFIRGAILNNCTGRVYRALAPEIEKRLGIMPMGYLPKMPDCAIESRHLGLVTAQEIEDLKQKLDRLAEQAEKSLDIDGILALSKSAPQLAFTPITPRRREPVRLGVARDRAFCFYYEDSLGLLMKMGADIVTFSPLDDERLPDGLDGLYIGGGYPELYAKRLSQNVSMRESVCCALRRGLPCIAECGGFMYLTERIADFPMVGFIKGGCFDSGRLTRFGYVTLEAERGSMLCPKGGRIPAHEFHRYDADDCGDAFTASKADGRSWPCVHAGPALYAGFPHLHFYANPEFAEGFYNAMLAEKEKRHV
ncbi:MAG: cobyrinate a,c-diamide synthase [Clostridia bacterium]|nr:cobyrinate a,c-diamide synthase [Clostridia bacterium]MBQ4341255.1 cobyrinate a,c-diamide synthase [Clostridia bacterium]